MTIAQCFNIGWRARSTTSPEGTAEKSEPHTTRLASVRRDIVVLNQHAYESCSKNSIKVITKAQSVPNPVIEFRCVVLRSQRRPRLLPHSGWYDLAFGHPARYGQVRHSTQETKRVSSIKPLLTCQVAHTNLIPTISPIRPALQKVWAIPPDSSPGKTQFR
jgi:hypothetical protein